MIDTLPTGIAFDSWVLQNGAQIAADQLSWSGMISAQQQITIAFTADLTTTTTFTGHVILNTATLTSTNGGGGRADAAFSVVGAKTLHLPLITRNH